MEHIIQDCERLGAKERAVFRCQQPDDESDAVIRGKTPVPFLGTSVGLSNGRLRQKLRLIY